MPNLKSRLRAFLRSASEEALGPLAVEMREIRDTGERASINAGRLLAQANAGRSLPRLQDYGFKVFSQFDEDGIIQRLVEEVGTPVERFVEIGVEDYSESNTRFLLMKNNWRGLLIDCGDEAARFLRERGLDVMRSIDFRQSFVTAENVDDLLRDQPEELGLLSIDVDGMDYWIWKATTVVRPRIVSIEYQSNFGPTESMVVPYDPAFERRKYHASELCYGASLAALAALGAAKGYALVGTSKGPNAFFVREDCLGGLEPTPPAECYYETRYRESRDAARNPTRLTEMRARRREIADCEVVDVPTGERRKVGSYESLFR